MHSKFTDFILNIIIRVTKQMYSADIFLMLYVRQHDLDFIFYTCYSKVEENLNIFHWSIETFCNTAWDMTNLYAVVVYKWGILKLWRSLWIPSLKNNNNIKMSRERKNEHYELIKNDTHLSNVCVGQWIA